jgi:hypothetical protein
MPALKPVPGAIDVVVSGKLGGVPWSIKTTWGNGAALEYSGADTAALCVAMADTFHTNVIPIVSDMLTTTEVVATDLYSDTAPRTVYTYADTGGQSGAYLPANVALVIKFIQDRRYRGGKSHIFLPGMLASQLTSENTWSDADLSAWNTAWSAVEADMHAVHSVAGPVFSHVAVSRFTGNAERVTPVIYAITETAPEPRVCSRRRRLGKIAG